MLIEGALVYGVLRARTRRSCDYCPCAVCFVALFASVALVLFTPLPLDTWPEARTASEAEARALAASGAALPAKSYLIALNLFNNEEIIGATAGSATSARWRGARRKPTLIICGRMAAATVRRPRWLNWGLALAARGIQHKVVAGNSSWWDSLPSASHFPLFDARGDECEFLALRNCAESVRIPVMALIRNMALLPLFGAETVHSLYAKAAAASTALRANPSRGGSGYVAKHLGFSAPTQVLFLNDVLLYARDVIELLGTEGGRYDLACSCQISSPEVVRCVGCA